MRRGRPRHDDVLTPREWQVLDLLREGLTNDQIAARLGISYDTAKFHVSEILGKLEVQTREEAAAWQGRPKVAFGLAPLLAILHKPPHAGWLAIGAAAVALVVLAAGVLIMAVRDGSDDEPAAVATPGETATATVTATTAPGPTPTPSSGTREPPFAPDGRTGDARLDAIIEDMLTADAATLAERYAQARVSSTFGGSQTPADVWTQRLVAADRRLYAVYRREVHQDIFLEVTTPAGDLEGWQVIVQAGRVLEIRVQTWPDQDNVTPANVRRLVLQTPDVGRNYGSYLVLPPLDQLPGPPGHQPLSTRTGDSGVDALLSLLEARDAAGLLASLATPDSLRFRHCGSHETIEDQSFAEAWAAETIAQVSGLHAVARLPDGYQPEAGHILILLRKVNPLLWEAVGILELGGRITGVLGGQFCWPESMYPPGTFIVTPPADGAGDDTARRSGIPIVDAILDAAAAGDTDAMAGLIVYQAIECGDILGIGAPPGCPPGVAPGTPVEVFPSSVCHGEYATPDQVPATLIRTAALPLFAVVAVDEDIAPAEGPTPPRPPIYLVVLAGSDGGSVSLTVGADGVTYSRGSCGAHHPQWLVPGVNPDFLLAPP